MEEIIKDFQKKSYADICFVLVKDEIVTVFSYFHFFNKEGCHV